MSHFRHSGSFRWHTIAVLGLALVSLRTASASGGPTLTIDASPGLRYPISPNIYGMNYADQTLATELKVPVDRFGGDAATRYNWQVDSYNSANDYFFESYSYNANPGLLPNGSQTDQFVDSDRISGAKTLMSLPLIGWTPINGSFLCSFSVAKYGAQNSVDPNHTDCGDGFKPGVKVHVTGNDPHDANKQIDQTFDTAWIAHLIGKYGTAANGGVAYYDMDNEPEYWHDIHFDVHPNPLSYDELGNLTKTYAAAVKAADPSALVLGPTISDWYGYFDSPVDNGNTNDRDAHGGVPLIEWYLQQMKAYEVAHGVRILDYVDVHYYTTAPGISLGGAGDAATQALRLRSTRELWDPTYVNEGYIGTPIDLIPMMRTWVANDYPGTKINIGEYNWGGLDDINGALAQADILGIFGRERADMAEIWAPPASNQPGAYAFRMYRNYDGAGSQFGDTAVSSSSADQGQLAVYGAIRGSDGALTLMMVNKTASALTSTLNLSNFAPGSSAKVYRYSTANLNAIVQQADQAVTAGGFSATYPANSITLVVIPAGTPAAGQVDSIGIYRTGTFYLRLYNSTGIADIAVPFTAGTTPYPIVGDWTGAGYDTIGVYDQSNGLFSLRNSNTPGAPDEQFVLGIPNDQPLSGRWLVTSTNAGVGVFRPSNGLIYLKTALTTGYANYTMVLGIPGDVGLAGDWNGKGFDSPGVYRPSNSFFYMSNQVTNGSVIGDYQAQYGLGGDAPVVGDWTAQGHDGIGLFRQSNGFTYLKNALVTGYADNTFTYGIAGDVPVAGHWQAVYPPIAPVSHAAPPILLPKGTTPKAPINGGSTAGDNPLGD